MRGDGSDLERGVSSSDMADMTARLRRIERLAAWQELQWEMARHREEDRTARFARSIGVVVDDLAARGLVEMRGLRTHIERSFHIVDVGGSGDRSGKPSTSTVGRLGPRSPSAGSSLAPRLAGSAPRRHHQRPERRGDCVDEPGLEIGSGREA